MGSVTVNAPAVSSAQFTTSPSGGLFVTLPSGVSIPIIHSLVTTLGLASMSGIVTATDTPVPFNNAIIDENAAGDVVNGTILIPPTATHFSLSAALRWAQSATTAGFRRRIYVQADDGSNTWGVPISAISEVTNYPNPGTGNAYYPINSFATEKTPIAALHAEAGFTVTKLRLVCQHDAGANLSLRVLGNIGGYAATFSARFYY